MTYSSLTSDQQKLVVLRTQHYISKAENLFNIKSEPVEITFNLKGRTAGMYRVHTSGNFLLLKFKREIRYNSFIFAKYFDDNFETTIPHEVAHYISDIIYGLKNIKPHGKEWKAIMHAFNADDSVTARYDLSGIPRRKLSLFTYLCECREHRLTSIRHNRILKQRQLYYCHACKQALKLKTNEVISNTK